MNYQHTCQFCGTSFWSQRSTGKYCSANCRTAYSRLPAKMDRIAGEIREKIFYLVDQREAFPHLKDRIDKRLDELKTIVDYAIPSPEPETPTE